MYACLPADMRDERGGGEADLDGDTEALVEGEGAALASHLADAVHHARELAGLAGTHVRGQARTGEIQRVHDQQRTGTRKTPCTPPPRLSPAMEGRNSTEGCYPTLFKSCLCRRFRGMLGCPRYREMLPC